jgi:hypothetical protein
MESTFKFLPKLLINIVDCRRNCSGQFQLSKADINDEANNSSSEESGGRDEESPRRNTKNDENDYREIISPALYVPHDIYCELTNESG